MAQALNLAHEAATLGEVPIGAVVVAGGKIIAKGYNQVEHLTDATAHAEMIALTAAAHHLGSKYLPDCTLYVTLEPCLMCAAALRWAQIGSIVYGASDEKLGFTGLISVTGSALLHPQTSLQGGIMAEECAALLKDFFRARRP